jgi:pimeloyl-ACP methyl ester carboxylesterase
MTTRHDQTLQVVLVHGGWHCGESWGQVGPLIRASGHRVITLDLPAHGWRARFPNGYFTADQADLATASADTGGSTLQSAADLLIEELRLCRTRDANEPIVLVSHSSSGAIASLAAETAPELIDHLVYIAAFVPSRMKSALEVLALAGHGSQTMDGLLIADPASTGVLRINPRSTDPRYRELLRRTFYSDLETEAAEAFLGLLVPDQPLSFVADPVSVTSARWGSVPRTYVVTSQDQSVAPELQIAVIEDADALHPEHLFRRVVMDTGHSPFATRPRELADVIVNTAAG